ncbi:MAG: hypothetical protein J6K16_02725 [Alphaproteobacteria bacterium]|nr:hypothetical protein [Alphaproteobacteria bacterium]
MKEIIDLLRNSHKASLGGKADVRHNIDARKYLAEEEMAVFPDEFFTMVKYANGIRGDGINVYGILPDAENTNFKDAVYENERLDRSDISTISVLGDNEFDYLVYDNLAKEYQMRDKLDDVVTYNFATLEQAIKYMFGL